MTTVLLIVLFNLVVFITGGQKCGVRPPLTVNSWRIVGGHPVKQESWPWMASVRLKQSSDFKVCGATLISDQWIVSAAHCFRIDDDPNNWLVGLNTNISGKLTQNLLGVSKIVIHPKSSEEHGVYNDIALIKLNQTLDFNERHKHLTPICLSNKTNYDFNSTQCVITGWGRLTSDGQSSDVLQEAVVPIVNSTVCFNKFGFKIDVNTNICAAGSKAGALGTCIGDSGGPLLCKLNDQLWYQFGIISWGIACAKPDTPDVFTKVSAYIDWIQEIIH